MSSYKSLFVYVYFIKNDPSYVTKLYLDTLRDHRDVKIFSVINDNSSYVDERRGLYLLCVLMY